jgi:hypothetical protein
MGTDAGVAGNADIPEPLLAADRAGDIRLRD